MDIILALIASGTVLSFIVVVYLGRRSANRTAAKLRSLQEKADCLLRDLHQLDALVDEARPSRHTGELILDSYPVAPHAAFVKFAKVMQNQVYKGLFNTPVLVYSTDDLYVDKFFVDITKMVHQYPGSKPALTHVAASENVRSLWRKMLEDAPKAYEVELPEPWPPGEWAPRPKFAVN